MFKWLEDQIDNIESLILLSSLNLVYMLGLVFFPKSLLVEGSNKFFFLIAFFWPIHLLCFSDSKILLIIKCIIILQSPRERKHLLNYETMLSYHLNLKNFFVNNCKLKSCKKSAYSFFQIHLLLTTYPICFYYYLLLFLYMYTSFLTFES